MDAVGIGTLGLLEISKGGHQGPGWATAAGTGEGPSGLLGALSCKAPSGTSRRTRALSLFKLLQGCMIPHYLPGMQSILDLEFGFLFFSFSSRHF